MRSVWLLAVACLLLITACTSDQQLPEQTREPTGPSLRSSPPCPSPANILLQIIAIVKPGDGRLATAIIKYNEVLLALAKHNQVKAQQKMFDLLRFLTTEYNNGNLISGTSSATQDKLTKLIPGLYCLVGLTAPVIDPAALGPDGALAVVDSASTDTVVTPIASAGVLVNARSAPTASLITITRIHDTPPPLLTPLDQYPAFYEFQSSPPVAFSTDVIVGVCQVDDYFPSDPDTRAAIKARLKIGHNIGSTIEILPLVPAPFLNCDDITVFSALDRRGGVFGLAMRSLEKVAATVLLPEYAHAATLATGGIGGTTRHFSPFGSVDPTLNESAASDTSITAVASKPVPSSVLPRVRVLTPSGNPVQGLTVTFTALAGQGSVSGAVQVTDSDGFATVGGWTVGAGPAASQVQATVTPIPGTVVNFGPVIFTAAIIPAVQVPYGASGYAYKLIGNSAPPSGWQNLSYVPTYWSSGSAAFGSGGACGLSHATLWPAATKTSPASAPSHNKDILLRHAFSVPTGGSGGVTMSVAIDNDIQVFVNGYDITASAGSTYLVNGFQTHEGCATQGSFIFFAPDAYLFPDGNNVIAVRARDRGVESYVDLKARLGSIP